MGQKPTTNSETPTQSPDQPVAARSRSEIESALSGNTNNKKNTRPNANRALDLNEPPRRQQVLGGDLTGVTSRPKFGLFSRYSDVSVVNWVACGIILMILAAFFWPQDNISTQEVVGKGTISAPQLGETDLSEDEQTDFLESESSSSLPFSRDDDLIRASSYRKQDQHDLKVRSLLARAQSEIDDGKYTQPAGQNATETYKSILEISQRNVEARQGLDFIANHFLTRGHSALEQNNKAVVENALNKLAIVQQGSDEYIELESAYAGWKTQRRVLILLDNAKSTFDKGALILPAKENALYFYQQALLLDDSNQAAKLGIQNISDSFIQQANDAALSGQFQTASAHLATVSIIDPNHSSIALVEAMIARAKPLVEKALAAQQQQLSTFNAQLLDSTSESTQQQAENSNTEIANATNTRTPIQQTFEQEAFDKQYLKQGLEAYYEGEYETASALLQPLADKGIARAQFKIAYMYFLGRGFKRDRATADSIIRTALPAIQKFAEDGRPWAQFNLGSLYEDGLVLSRDYTDAVFWYRSAAEQGFPGAQTSLGAMYARGRGVASSRRTAIEWFQRAAKQGDSIAQRNLKTMGVN